MLALWRRGARTVSKGQSPLSTGPVAASYKRVFRRTVIHGSLTAPATDTNQAARHQTPKPTSEREAQRGPQPRQNRGTPPTGNQRAPKRPKASSKKGKAEPERRSRRQKLGQVKQARGAKARKSQQRKRGATQDKEQPNKQRQGQKKGKRKRNETGGPEQKTTRKKGGSVRAGDRECASDLCSNDLLRSSHRETTQNFLLRS